MISLSDYRVIIFIALGYSAIAYDSKFEACAPRNCGKGPNISYPFWISGLQESNCGYPNFEISCNQNYPVLTFLEDNFIIKDIFYSNHSFILARVADYEDKCNPPLHNISLERTPFSLASVNVNLLFCYNCSSKPMESYTYPVNCGIPSIDNTFAYFHTDESPSMNLSCESFVGVPVDITTDYASLRGMSYDDILKMGFLLNFTAANCSACESSGGRCGFENEEFVCYCHDGTHAQTCDHDSWSTCLKTLIVAGAVIGGIVLAIILFFLIRRQHLFSKRYSGDEGIEDFIRQYGSLTPKRYNYSEVKRMTNSFKEKLGQGGYGAVYKGMLQNGCSVAVKILNTSKGSGEDFINEVASISKTSHVNIVTLLGFCFEGKKGALIYEFMANGSLDKFIYDGTISSPHAQLEWEKLYQIAIGIARGLEYLHRGCNTRILHFDIKPHNILLDENFHPKISDFGLAKLCLKRESIVSMMIARGTIGYIAPEVFNRNFGRVSPKSDVYSYGMMVLEMIGLSKRTKVEVDCSSQLYFPNWIYKCVELGHDFELCYNLTSETREIFRKMTLVGLWCIQMKPSKRPSISKVIEMLEGSVEALQIPPKPFFTSLPRALESSYSTSSLFTEE